MAVFASAAAMRIRDVDARVQRLKIAVGCD